MKMRDPAKHLCPFEFAIYILHKTVFDMIFKVKGVQNNQ